MSDLLLAPVKRLRAPITRAADSKWARLLVWSVSASGFAFIGMVFVLFPAWADMLVWDRVGDEIRSGISPYYSTPIGVGFYYAPPWAIAFALLTWMPPVVLHAAITLAELAALRYLTGSWLWAGAVCWTLPMWREVQVGQFNLILAASIAAACRRDPPLAVIMTAAKLSPILAMDPRDWRKAVPVAVVLAGVTLPWLSLWGDWVDQLVRSFGTTIAPGNAQLMIPYSLQLAVAVGLLLFVRRSWARAASAIVALPAIYWPTSALTLLAFAPLIRDRKPR